MDLFGPMYDVISDVIMAEIAQNLRKSVSLRHLHGSESFKNHVTALYKLLLDVENIKCHLGPFWTNS